MALPKQVQRVSMFILRFNDYCQLLSNGNAKGDNTASTRRTGGQRAGQLTVRQPAKVANRVKSKEKSPKAADREGGRGRGRSRGTWSEEQTSKQTS